MALGIDYNSGIPHTNGAPTHDPGTNGGKLAYDHVNRVKYKHVSGTTWEVDASGGGGGDSLGTGFTSGGGSGTIPGETVVTLDGSFEIDPAFPGFISKFVKNPAGYGDLNNFLGFYQSDDKMFGAIQDNAGDADFAFFGRFSDGGDYASSFKYGYSNIAFTSSAGTLEALFQAAAGEIRFAAADLGSFPQEQCQFSLQGKNFIIKSTGSGFQGARYDTDYSTFIIANDRSIPDVGTVKQINLLGPAQYTTTARNALLPSAGWTIYCTDATANDASTGVMQTYNGSTWKNHW